MRMFGIVLISFAPMLFAQNMYLVCKNINTQTENLYMECVKNDNIFYDLKDNKKNIKKLESETLKGKSEIVKIKDGIKKDEQKTKELDKEMQKNKDETMSLKKEIKNMQNEIEKLKKEVEKLKKK
ncbi:MAG: hypothetical protein LBD84_03095 [Campylobacteraceae bacterium]|nr:hypothetical protein [Campylobacteraceae bacterium]